MTPLTYKQGGGGRKQLPDNFPERSGTSSGPVRREFRTCPDPVRRSISQPAKVPDWSGENPGPVRRNSGLAPIRSGGPFPAGKESGQVRKDARTGPERIPDCPEKSRTCPDPVRRSISQAAKTPDWSGENPGLVRRKFRTGRKSLRTGPGLSFCPSEIRDPRPPPP